VLQIYFIRIFAIIQLLHIGRRQAMYAKYVELRDKKGVRDADVAKGTGIDPSTFTDWKKNTCQPKLEKLLKIADYFGVTINEFIDAR